jgi:hypothetical protein
MLGASYCLLFSFIKSLQFYSLLALWWLVKFVSSSHLSSNLSPVHGLKNCGLAR